jgi:uncharacterized protein
VKRGRSSSTRKLAALAVGVLLAVAGLRGLPVAWRYVQLLSVDLLLDDAGLVAPDQREQLEAHHQFLRIDHDVDYRVQTIRGVEDINLYAVRRFDELDVGGLSGNGRGLLLVIDAERDLVRLEVGYALEPVMPDAFVAYIEHRQMVPFFQHRRVADGILATTELVVARIQNAKANAGWENEAWLPGSGGGGATTRARLGAKPGGEERGGPEVLAADSPEGTLEAYRRAMAARNASPTLDIYSSDTRRMLANWVVTPAQMDNILRSYRDCQPEPVRYDAGSRHAVIRYPVPERQCSPWFFVHESGRWRLDLTMMQTAIRFGRSNAWRFASGVEHPYAFAFEDWSFDRNGFPRAVN